METKYYLGIDIGKRNHAIALTDKDGKLLMKTGNFAATSEGWQKFVSHLEKLIDHTEYPSVLAGMEATGHYWLTYYLKLKELGMQVSVLNPLEVKAFRNEGIRGNKTDAIDAEKLAKLLRFGEFKETYVPEGDLIALRQLTRLRGDFEVMLTGMKQKILAVLDQTFPEYRTVFKKVWSATSLAILTQAHTPEAITLLSTRELVAIARKASRGRIKEGEIAKLQTMAKETIGVKVGGDMFSLALDILLSQIEHLQGKIDLLEKKIADLSKNLEPYLVSIPGIGPITNAITLAEIGNFNRFIGLDGAEKLVAFAGIDPKLKTSGQFVGKTKMSKRGSPYLRCAIRQSAFVAVFTAKDPMFSKIYEKQINRGKHFEVALSHVERKMLHVIYSLLKNKTEYVPKI